MPRIFCLDSGGGRENWMSVPSQTQKITRLSHLGHPDSYLTKLTVGFLGDLLKTGALISLGVQVNIPISVRVPVDDPDSVVGYFLLTCGSGTRHTPAPYFQHIFTQPPELRWPSTRSKPEICRRTGALSFQSIPTYRVSSRVRRADALTDLADVFEENRLAAANHALSIVKLFVSSAIAVVFAPRGPSLIRIYPVPFHHSSSYNLERSLKLLISYLKLN
ncbi:unnamed protein product [Nesidiocoris tenuis]|uniref:Uncharacterized protein n=1 Tax=Nesidiocoris tenuis TaxID=355587 RepID=A0A6H5GNZ9_9HEMI|nr:unnamed protein product [Nesidiocoris tenuis]